MKEVNKKKVFRMMVMICGTIAAAVMLTVLLSPAIVKAEEKLTNTIYPTYYVVNCEESTPLFSEPDKNSSVIADVSLGTPVSYIGTADAGYFYKVACEGDVGYMMAAYVGIDDAAADSKGAEAPEGQTLFVINCHESITLRATPTTSGSELCQIPLNASVTYLGSAQNGFYRISYDGREGYGLASYLTTPSDLSHPGITMYVVNCNEWITLRKVPDTSAEEITKIPLGAAVSFESSADRGFYQITYNGQKGYALASYLSTYYYCPTPSWSRTMYVVNCNEWISLRTSPSTSASRITTMPLGAAVEYLGNAGNGFYQVRYNGSTGYALACYLGDSYYSSTDMYVVNCNEWISLRTSPSTSASRITTIPLGARVTYLGNAGNGFYQINYNGNTGYALASYLSGYRSSSSSSSSSSSGGNTMYVINCNEWISLRSSPSTEASRITTIPLGASVTFLSTASNGFYKVSYNGYTGYALASYLGYSRTSSSSSGSGDGYTGGSLHHGLVQFTGTAIP